VSASDLLQLALTTADLRQALQAARTLAEQPGEVPALLPRLAAALSDVRPQTARRAAQLHGALGTLAGDNLPILLAALKHPRWTVREAVVGALGKVGGDNSAVHSALVDRALFDRTSAVRDWALAILKENAGDVLPAVRVALVHAHPRVRCRALRALAQLALREEQLTTLSKALDDSHFRVRRDAARLLGQIGSGALPALPRLARCRFDGEPRVAQAAANALGRMAAGAAPMIAEWLRRLTEGDDAMQVLRTALQTSELPEAVRASFIAVCRRRQAWLARRRGVGQQVDTASAEADPVACVESTLAAAGKRAAREAAWLIGWLLDELLRHGQETPAEALRPTRGTGRAGDDSPR
jgi:HEAT repeat protein